MTTYKTNHEVLKKWHERNKDAGEQKWNAGGLRSLRIVWKTLELNRSKIQMARDGAKTAREETILYAPNNEMTEIKKQYDAYLHEDLLYADVCEAGADLVKDIPDYKRPHIASWRMFYTVLVGLGLGIGLIFVVEALGALIGAICALGVWITALIVERLRENAFVQTCLDYVEKNADLYKNFVDKCVVHSNQVEVLKSWRFFGMNLEYSLQYNSQTKLRFFIDLYNGRRATTLKDVINLYNLEEHQQNVESWLKASHKAICDLAGVMATVAQTAMIAAVAAEQAAEAATEAVKKSNNIKVNVDVNVRSY